MSTDFNIPIKELKDQKLLLQLIPREEKHVDPHTGETFIDNYHECKLAGYPYLRACDVHGDELHISCSGQFRNWLTEWLQQHRINFQQF